MKGKGHRGIVVLMLLGLIGIAPAFAVEPFTVIADGLAFPRGLAMGPGGVLYVAQAGAGGGTATSKITGIRNPGQTDQSISDVVTGLTSITSPEGDVIGAAGVSAIGNGTIYAAMESSNLQTGFTSQLGFLIKGSQGGQVRDVADVGDFDWTWSIQHHDLAPRDFPDSNPYGVLALASNLYVTDAATNTLDLVHPDGSISILAFFPSNVIADATPTCVAQGPDGALYIGTLALVDSLVFGPSAKVYRVDPSETNPNDLNTVLHVATLWTSNLWPINGCAFGPDGSFYVSELITNAHFSGGDVVKIPFATPAVHTSLTNDALNFAAGVAVGPDGTVYVSNWTTGPPNHGQVLRLTKR